MLVEAPAVLELRRNCYRPNGEISLQAGLATVEGAPASIRDQEAAVMR